MSEHEAAITAALRAAADRIAAHVNLERDGPEDAAYAHAVSLVLDGCDRPAAAVSHEKFDRGTLGYL